MKSDDIDDQRPATSTVVSSSKFLKKIQTPTTTQAAGAPSQCALGNVHARCSALGKAESFAAKYSAARRVTTLSSDSDIDLNLSADDEVKHTSTGTHT